MLKTVMCALCIFSSFAQISADSSIDVPFVKQEKNGCGAAVMSMVIAYWNEQGKIPAAIEADQIMQQLYSARDGGILASQMIDFFKRNGFHAFAWSGSTSELQLHLERGRPIIAAIGSESNLHYVVIAGFSELRQTITLNDPARRKLLAMDRNKFEREWAKADRWMLLAVPENQPIGTEAQK